MTKKEMQGFKIEKVKGLFTIIVAAITAGIMVIPSIIEALTDQPVSSTTVNAKGSSNSTIIGTQHIENQFNYVSSPAVKTTETITTKEYQAINVNVPIEVTTDTIKVRNTVQIPVSDTVRIPQHNSLAGKWKRKGDTLIMIKPDTLNKG